MLGLLIGGLILGGSAIKAGIENANMMSKPYTHLDDGTPIYIDRNCNEYVNGERMIATYDYKNQKLVYAGKRSGKVYIDPEANQRKRMDEMSEKNKREAIAKGMLAYLRYDHKREKSLTCEISTGKYIAQLKGKEDGTYWKYYLPDYEMILFSSPAEGDNGIEITQEEYDKLNILVVGTHYASDLYRYTCYMDKGAVRWKRRKGR
ncbi:MAG: hypothetical protein IJA10_10805 [Lachnospiraceae bacterium]|nr:hypothetical protein [Lachnospiraceae bacterium]